MFWTGDSKHLAGIIGVLINTELHNAIEFYENHKRYSKDICNWKDLDEPIQIFIFLPITLPKPYTLSGSSPNVFESGSNFCENTQKVPLVDRFQIDSRCKRTTNFGAWCNTPSNNVYSCICSTNNTAFRSDQNRCGVMSHMCIVYHFQWFSSELI